MYGRICGSARDITPALSALLVLLGAWVLLGLGAAERPYDDHDVSRYAQMAYEGRTAGTLIPTLHHEPYFEAMPLVAWCPLAVAKLEGGVDPGTARLVPALAAVGMVLLTLLLVRGGYGIRLALLAAGICALNALMIQGGRGSRIDTVLGLGVAGSLAAAYQGTRSGRLAWFLVSGLGLSLAVAAKGPMSCALVGAAVVPWLAWERRWRPLLLGGAITLGVAAVLTAAWLLPYLAYAGPAASKEFARLFLLGENVSMVEGLKNKVSPPWSYEVDLLVRFAPWAPLSVWGLVQTWRRPRVEGEPPALDRLAVCWLLVPLALLSVAAGKTSRYLIPLLPALSLLAALGLRDLARFLPERAWRPAGAALGAALLLAGLGSSLVLTALAGWTPYAVLTGVLVAAAGAAALRARTAARPDRLVLAVYLGAAGCVGWVYAAVFPLRAANGHGYVGSVRELAAELPADRPLTVADPRASYEAGAVDEVMLAMYLHRDVARSETPAPASFVLAPAARGDLTRGREVMREFAWSWHRGCRERWMLLGPLRPAPAE